jgi:hypothetical protein
VVSGGGRLVAVSLPEQSSVFGVFQNRTLEAEWRKFFGFETSACVREAWQWFETGVRMEKTD